MFKKKSLEDYCKIEKKDYLLKQWDYIKNNNLKPSDFTYKSNKKVWWVCDNGHNWEAQIYNRVNGNNCPYCSGRYAISGKNDLATLMPHLLNEWNFHKNKDLKPQDISSKSGKKVWWICNQGHEWQATPYHRSNGTNCPYCSGRYAIDKKTDLKTINFKISDMWHPTKNKNLTPSQITSKSNKKVWWICENGHEWEAKVSSMSNGMNCPYCSGRYALRGYNDLLTVNPTLASEWNYIKNENLFPYEVTTKSSKKVWWICNKGHEWEARINNRANGNNCPICSNKKLLQGFNDLETLNSKLCKEWHPTKNKDLKPSHVLSNSSKKVWWICNFCKFEYQRTIEYKSRKISKCPNCRN